MEADAPAPLGALVEMTSTTDPNINLEAIDAALGVAAAGGAAMAFLPEMSLLLDSDRARSASLMVREADSRWLTSLQAMAKHHALWLHSGSMPLLADDGARRVNRSHVIAADGSIKARYDKIHMFDVSLPSGETWTESKAYAGGDELVLVDTPLGRLGLSICFDLRFPELYRALVQAGAEIISVPAAFTVSTGQAHWHVLLRARAIETACHMVAAAQGGDHADGRATYGHSLAVDPWGNVLVDVQPLVDAQVAPWRVALAPICHAAMLRAREAIPLDRSRDQRRISL